MIETLVTTTGFLLASITLNLQGWLILAVLFCHIGWFVMYIHNRKIRKEAREAHEWIEQHMDPLCTRLRSELLRLRAESTEHRRLLKEIKSKIDDTRQSTQED